MDNKHLELAEEEISLVDILKIIWKYRWFIIIITLILSILSFSIFFASNYISTKKAIESNYKYVYSTNIIIPEISWDLYNKIVLKFDFLLKSKILENYYGIKDFKIELVEKNVKEPYQQSNFPVNSLKFNFYSNKKLDEKYSDDIKIIIKNVIFTSYINILFSDIKNQVSNILNASKLNVDSEITITNIIVLDLMNKVNEIIKIDSKSNYNDFYNDINKLIENLDISKNNYLKYVKEILSLSIKSKYNLVNNLNIDILSNVLETELNIKSVIKKTIIVFIASIFVSIFLSFFIDFFKKNWKEIVK